jgi:acetyl-CoA C-acetyltransferase
VVDPRTPVLVGAGQAQQRAVEPLEAREPIDLLAAAAGTAEADTGATRSVLQAVDTVATVEIVSWPYPDPGALLARRLGIEPRTTMTSTVGGNSPQLLLNELAASIAAGDRRVVLLGGAECVHTRWRARREPKIWLPWTQADDPPCSVVIGDPRPGTNDDEMAHAAVAPTTIYPLFETALRARHGRGVDEHQVQTSELWARFAAVARENPHAWSRDGWSASEIRTVAPENRVVAFPYTKRMCANIDVDQAAAVLLCSYEAARELGVPDDRLVFPLAGADARDHFFVSERWSLAESPAIRSVGHAALEAAGVTIDEVARFDLYSCFPSAVQIAMDALGLAGEPGGDVRPLTVTGGLGFAGGPANNDPTHAIAAMVEACRRDPGSVGMVTALGWYVTKHSAGLYSTTPPASGFRRVPATALQPELDARPRRQPAGPYEGTATIEATSVVFTRDGRPELGIIAALTPDGRRVLANERDTDALASMVDEPWEGRTVKVETDGAVNHLVAP